MRQLRLRLLSNTSGLITPQVWQPDSIITVPIHVWISFRPMPTNRRVCFLEMARALFRICPLLDVVLTVAQFLLPKAVKLFHPLLRTKLREQAAWMCESITTQLSLIALSTPLPQTALATQARLLFMTQHVELPSLSHSVPITKLLAKQLPPTGLTMLM